MRIRAHAKINWLLDITGVREDGYHLMDMLMQPVTLHDTVVLEPADELTLTVSGEPTVPPDEHNLALRAARALQLASSCEKGASIHVIKRIPAGAGMGGGSADAAAVLWGLNQLWGLGCSQEALESMGLRLGADVPFCLRGGLQRVQGIGEAMDPCGVPPEVPLCVIQPCEGLSTREVFTAWHQEAEHLHAQVTEAAALLAAGKPVEASRLLTNALQPVSETMRPEIREAIQALENHGAYKALMTGSGSAVFGMFETEAKAAEAAQALRSIWPRCWACHSCGESLNLE